MGFWVGSTGKFSSGAGQITLQRLAHFFFFVSESSPSKLRHIRSKKGPKCRARRLGKSSKKGFKQTCLFHFLELTVSFDFELSS